MYWALRAPVPKPRRKATSPLLQGWPRVAEEAERINGDSYIAVSINHGSFKRGLVLLSRGLGLIYIYINIYI